MNVLNSCFILLAALIGVYLESTLNGFRRIFGAQIDVLPVLAVYAALRSGPVMLAILAVFGGLCLDSLSANPLGVTIFPVFLAGFMIYIRRGLILQEQLYAQFVLGMAAGAFVPALTVLMLLTTRQTPVLGWGSIWQWMLVTAMSGLLTPACFWLFDRLDRALTYHPTAQTSFREDREIARGHK